MKRSTTNQLSRLKRVLILPLIAVFGLFPVTSVFADNYDAQIQQLQNEINGYQSEAGRLRAEADTLQNAVATLDAQKKTIQAQVDLSQAKYDKLSADIEANQKKLEKQKRVYAERVADLSSESKVSPIELLARSDSIGDYVRSDIYQSSVQDQIETAIKQVKILKEKLSKQKADVERVLADQTAQRNELAAKQNEQAALLASTQGQEAAYQNLIGQKNTEISGLRAAQAAANARFIGPAGSGPACGGGYPGVWCNVPMDSVVDNWGMYNRECVSYAAFKVAASGRHMPYWGGYGNANQWDDNAIAAGIPTDFTPRAGDVAISNAGYYGHAMYVESVNANGTINISQYNASWTGTYSTNTISPSGLVFIHF